MATAETSWENRLFTNCQPHIHCTIYIMPNGDVRRSHSANVFKVTGRIEEEINQRPKRLREENNPSPDIFAETPSTATLVEECSTVNPKFLSPETHNQKSTNYLAIKLNRLKDKQVRFESHREFLSRCITNVLVPKGLELMLEPTIRNYDQNFLDSWYSKPKQFSLSLIKVIVQFCGKTIDATTTEINTTESSLKSNTNQDQFKAIQSEIKNNEAAARKILQQRKFKKFNTLKYKPNAATQGLTQKEDGIQEKTRNPLYSDILKRIKKQHQFEKKDKRK